MIQKLIKDQVYKWLAPDTARDRMFKVLGHFINNENLLVYTIEYLNPPYYKIGGQKIWLDGKKGVLEITHEFIEQNLKNLSIVNRR